MGWFSKNDLEQDDSRRGDQSALNDGTPVTILYSDTRTGKVTVEDETTNQCRQVAQSDIAESNKKGRR